MSRLARAALAWRSATPASTLTLKLAGVPRSLRAGLRCGTGAVLLGSALAASLSSEHTGGFSGAVIGLFAEAGETNQPAAMPPADFDWFEYQPLAAR